MHLHWPSHTAVFLKKIPFYNDIMQQHSLTHVCKADIQSGLTKFCEYLRDYILDTLHKLSNAHSWQKIVVANCKIRGPLPWANHSMCHIGKCWRSVACLFIGVSKVPQQRVAFWAGFNYSSGESWKYSIYTDTNMSVCKFLMWMYWPTSLCYIYSSLKHTTVMFFPRKWKMQMQCQTH